MRHTQHVSVWPVGLSGYLRYEKPVLDNSGHVVDWFTAWNPHHKFALDMAGFAVNTRLLTMHRSAEFSYNNVSRGEQESYFLSQLVTLMDLEPKANNCTEVCYLLTTRTALSSSLSISSVRLVFIHLHFLTTAIASWFWSFDDTYHTFRNTSTVFQFQ